MRKQVSNSKILKEALRLFASKGYSDTKMTEIAQKSGLSVGTLYLRFKNKEQLCLELIYAESQGFENLVDEIEIATRPLEALQSYISLHMNYALKRKQLISMLLREQKLPFLKPVRVQFYKKQQKIIKNILTEGNRQKIFRKLDYDNMSMMIFSSIRGAVLFKHSFDIGSADSLTRSLFELICNGIRKDAS